MRKKQKAIAYRGGSKSMFAKGSRWVKEVLNYFLTKLFLYLNIDGMISVKQKRLSIWQRKH